MRKKIVLICVPAHGHTQRALLVTRGLVQAGAEVDVFTGSEFQQSFEREGGRFHDLYAGRPLDAADKTSMPIPSRFVTFAAVFGESLTREIARLSPDLIVHGTFAVVGVIAAQKLGVPRVALCAGHNLSPRVALPPLAYDDRVTTSPACLRAVSILRDEYGITNASPFSYFDSLSPTLNIIPEPKEFLQPDEANDFKPCEFFGCVDPIRMRSNPRDDNLSPTKRLQVYVSFGTHSHRYYAAVIERAFERIFEAATRLPEAKFVVTLGGAHLAVPSTIPDNVVIEEYADQPAILAESHIYLTHHGSNSTHEAIYLRRPMISYPLFADQPGLAKRCQEFGFAIPLVDEPRAGFEPSAVMEAIFSVEANRDRMLTRLEEGQRWEENVIKGRPEVIGKILACI